MPTKTIELLDSPGIIRDTPAHKLPDGAFSDGNNVRFAEEGVQTVGGNLPVLSAASVNPTWLYPFPPIGAPIWVYADANQVFAIDGDTHTEITRASGNYSGLTTERWQASFFNGVAILNNTVDIPQAWTEFDSGTQLVDLPNWDATRRAKSVRGFLNFLIALNMTDSGVSRPYRIVWSDSADAGTLPGSWDSTDPATDSREFDLAQTPDHLVDCLPMGDVNIVYKENSCWGMRHVGPPFFFRFWEILSKRGLLQRDCVRNTPIGHIVVTQDDIIVHRGQIESEVSILDKKQRKWLFQSIDPANFRNSFLMADNRRNEAYFCFPEVGETYSNKVLAWNWRHNSIAVRDIPTTPFGVLGPIGDSLIEDFAWG